MGTPFGFSQSESIQGDCDAGTVKRELGCAAGLPDVESHFCPRQSVKFFGGSLVIPSHHTSPSSVTATLVKIVFLEIVFMALGLLFILVPGATPKYPASGLMAYNFPSLPGLIQAMSSPTVVTFQPSNSFGGMSMAKLVLPHALGNAAAT